MKPRPPLLDAPADTGVIDAIYRGDALGIRVRRAFDPAALATAFRALRPPPARPLLGRHEPRAYGFGAMMLPTVDAPRGPEAAAYFAEVAAQPWLDASFPEGESTVARLLSTLGGRPAERLRSAKGVYAWGSLRVVEPGASIPVHCDLYGPSATFDLLHQLTDRRTQLSWYVPVLAPEQGGVLHISDPRQGRTAEPALEVVLDAGDWLLFDAGRWMHAVTPVVGDSPRVTLGGFAARSPGGDGLRYWA